MSYLLQFIDLTTLSGDDSQDRVKKLCQKAIEKRVAAVCVFPTFIKTCRQNLPEGFPVATVVGGFPHGQVPLEVKKLETKMAIDLGANEIDMVINRSFVLNGETHALRDEISTLANICHEHRAKLKTIIEVGELGPSDNIALASKVALESGSDFIKTSTGKASINANIEAASIMVNELKAFHEKNGELRGFKPAGGIKTKEQAQGYLDLMINAFGEDRVTPANFRIGASSLVSQL